MATFNLDPVNHQFVGQGPFTVSLLANGPLPSCNSSSTSQIVSYSTQLPLGASFTPNNYTVLVGQQVTFNYNGAVDPNIIFYQVNFGDGSTPLTISPGAITNPIYHTYNTSGNFTVRFTYGQTECNAYTTFQMNIVGCPTGQITYNSGSSCGITNFFAPALTMNSGFTYSWEWDFGDGCIIGPGNGDRKSVV